MKTPEHNNGIDFEEVSFKDARDAGSPAIPVKKTAQESGNANGVQTGNTSERNAKFERNSKTRGNIIKVFEEAQDLNSNNPDSPAAFALQDQEFLISKYLNPAVPDTGDKSKHVRMAPGVAWLANRVGQYGFGNINIDSGDETLDKEYQEKIKIQYKAAEDVFLQVMHKMYPDINALRGEALLNKLREPVHEGVRLDFDFISSKLQKLYKVPNTTKESLLYHEKIDELISFVSQVIQSLVVKTEEDDLKGVIKATEMDRRREDVFTLAVTLVELQRLRKESIRQTHGPLFVEKDYSPIDIKKIEEKELDSILTREAEVKKSSTLRPQSQSPQKPKATETQEKTPSLQAVAKELKWDKDPLLVNLNSARTPEAVRKVVTPEIIQATFSHALYNIDQSITQAEDYRKNHPGTVLDKKPLGLVFGPGLSGNLGAIYQKIGLVQHGKVMDISEIAKMSLVDFMKKFFDYDLAKDKARAEKLERYTNVFW